ncbi:MAG: choice-of-anchor D domain-containing protein [Deltaproteobacteria bacterium]
MRSWLVLLVAVGALACEGDQVVRQAPKLVLAPETDTVVDFGAVTIGDPVDGFRVLVKNEGNAALVFSRVFVESGQLSVIGAPTQITPDSSASLELRLAPAVPGLIEDALVLESNDPERPEARLQIRADVRAPCALLFAPSSASFAIDEVVTLRLENTSTSDCNLLELSTDETFFEITNPPELPLTLEAGATRPVDVRHTGSAFRGRPVRQLTARAEGGARATATLAGQERSRCLSVDREVIRFNTILPGDTASSFVNVVSECDHIVSITDLSIISADGGFSVDERDLPIVVAPSSRARVDATFSPVPGPSFFAQGLLNIQTDDYYDAILPVALEGFVVRPRGTLHPFLLTFEPVIYEPTAGPGSPSTCASEEMEALVINTGRTPLPIREVELDSAGEFELAYVDVAGTIETELNLPIEVPVDAVARFVLRYRPTAAAEHRGQLRIRHDGEERTQITALIGQGEPRSQITEVFNQPVTLAVDILWAIDASCSMGEEQEELIANLSQFVAYADANGVDYQMAVTEAEEVSSLAGTFEQCNGHPPIIDSNYMTSAVRDQVFACMFALGVNGVGLESGLGGAREALRRATDPNQNPLTNPNAGFVREDAELVIVAISDEDDQSSSPDIVLRDFFYGVKNGQRNRVSVHAIAGPLPTGCATASAGHRYSTLARQTNGQFYSICEDDWQPLLQNLGLDVFTPEDQWYLSRPAVESTLVVTVDGVPVANDPAAGWIYVPSRRLIVFAPNAVPPPGSQIVVTYMPGCAL